MIAVIVILGIDDADILSPAYELEGTGTGRWSAVFHLPLPGGQGLRRSNMQGFRVGKDLRQEPSRAGRNEFHGIFVDCNDILDVGR